MQKIKPAFTLFELIIVIIIIGSVYLLFFSGLTKQKKEVRDFADLKELILKKANTQNARVVCQGDKCEDCAIYIDGEEKKLETKLFNSKPKVFEYDKFGYLDEKKYNDNVCFEYNIHKNGGASNMLVEKDGRFYIFYSFLDRAEVFTERDKAIEKFDPRNSLPTGTNQYYYERR